MNGWARPEASLTANPGNVAYPRPVEILLWLVPPAVVTSLAMLWVSWLGREGRGQVDRDVAVRRLAAAMQKDPLPHTTRRPQPVQDRSTGIAVRPSRAGRPRSRSSPAAAPDFAQVRVLAA